MTQCRHLDIVEKKRSHAQLTREEITSIVQGYCRGEVPDELMAAFLMAVCCMGMDDSECAALTAAYVSCGGSLSWDGEAVFDKHSTGGVGDKTSLIVVPLAASLASFGCRTVDCRRVVRFDHSDRRDNDPVRVASLALFDGGVAFGCNVPWFTALVADHVLSVALVRLLASPGASLVVRAT